MARKGYLVAKRLAASQSKWPFFDKIFSSRNAERVTFVGFGVTIVASIYQHIKGEYANLMKEVLSTKAKVVSSRDRQSALIAKHEGLYLHEMKKQFADLAAWNQLLASLTKDSMLTGVVKRFVRKEVAGLEADLKPAMLSPAEKEAVARRVECLKHAVNLLAD